MHSDPFGGVGKPWPTNDKNKEIAIHLIGYDLKATEQILVFSVNIFY